MRDFNSVCICRVKSPHLISSAQAGKVVESLKHRYLVVEPDRVMLMLSRMLRNEALVAEKEAGVEGAGAWTPRVLVYTENDVSCRVWILVELFSR